MRAHIGLALLGTLLAATGCGPKKSEDREGSSGKVAKPAKAKSSAKKPTSDPGARPEGPRTGGEHRKLLKDLLQEKIPSSPAKNNGLESAQGWQAADWEDPATYKRLREKKTGRIMMYVGTKGGAKGKCAAVFTRDLCLAPKGAMRLAAYNYSAHSVRLGVAFWFSDSWVYYESPAKKLPPRQWTQLSFSLSAADYKTASSKWKHTASLWKREDTKRVAVLVYHGGKPVQLLIDGVTVDQAPRPKPKPKPKAKRKPAQAKPAKTDPSAKKAAPATKPNPEKKGNIKESAKKGDS